METIEAKFLNWCKRNKISSEQYKKEIYPVWEAGYRSALASKQEVSDVVVVPV